MPPGRAGEGSGLSTPGQRVCPWGERLCPRWGACGGLKAGEEVPAQGWMRAEPGRAPPGEGAVREVEPGAVAAAAERRFRPGSGAALGSEPGGSFRWSSGRAACRYGLLGLGAVRRAGSVAGGRTGSAVSWVLAARPAARSPPCAVCLETSSRGDVCFWRQLSRQAGRYVVKTK